MKEFGPVGGGAHQKLLYVDPPLKYVSNRQYTNASTLTSERLAGSGWRNGIMFASGVSDPGSMPGPMLWGSLHANEKRAQVTIDPP